MRRARGAHRVGRRGVSLLFFAVLDLIYAVSLLTVDPGDSPFFAWLARLLPLWAWAILWATIGLICLWYAFQRCDRWGFAAAIFLKIVWGLVSLGGWLLGGVERGWVSATIWLAFAGWVWVISGWPEEGDVRGPTWTPPTS